MKEGKSNRPNNQKQSKPIKNNQQIQQAIIKQSNAIKNHQINKKGLRRKTNTTNKSTIHQHETNQTKQKRTIRS